MGQKLLKREMGNYKLLDKHVDSEIKHMITFGSRNRFHVSGSIIM